jgi:DNA mismatch repair protein MutL
MQNLIQLLPDVLANQIAAGEVVQRPASVVKELLENAVDAQATRIDLTIKNAGKTLIQVTDNGSGMSAQDARMAFERHATSKIRAQDDLFNIRTLGFRGEALASIAAVAQVRLRSRLQTAEVGVELDVEASKVKKQEPWAGVAGSSFLVRNLFYNVPARRNFLKSNPVETRHIISEFVRVALPHPEIHFTFQHNDTVVYDLAEGDIEARIVALFGQDLQGELIKVDEATGYATFHGLIGSPAIHRKTRGDQYLFVNGRFIKSNYLNHAITTAFDEFIPSDHHPFYCIFLGIDPVHVDINIHPTKTEVKFDDDRTLYVLLHGLIKQGLADRHQAPAFDFGDTALQQAIYQSAPAQTSTGHTVGSNRRAQPTINLPHQQRQPARREDWEALYRPDDDASTSAPDSPAESPPSRLPLSPNRRAAAPDQDAFLVQYQGRYLLTQYEGNLLIIDQQLAHQRILFERFLHATQGTQVGSQQLLFPQTLEFRADDYLLLLEVDDLLRHMGFELKEFGRHSLIVYGTPAGVGTSKIREVFDQIVADVRQTGGSNAAEKRAESIARAVAQRCAIQANHRLSAAERQQLVQDLLRCQVPAFAPNNRPTFKQITEVELEGYFK